MAGPVRQQIDQAALERYLQDVPEIKLPLQVRQFGFGQSNPTYQLEDSSKNKFVLRKKPPGQLLSKTAHRVDREYQVLHALQHTDVPVPKVICFCKDDKVIGTEFYIMEFLQGRIFENPSFPGVTPDERTALWKEAVQTLAKLHRIPPKDIGLESFGKPRGFYNRQIKTFTSIAESQSAAKDAETGEAVGQLPHFDELVRFFGDERRQPHDRGVLYHGDYKIDNLVYHATEARVIGLLDWEMATVGHPLGDLCNLVQPWTISNATTSWPRIHADTAFLDRADPKSTNRDFPGLPSREDAVRWYSETVGFDVPDDELAWAAAFGLFRDSIIFQGIAARHATRQASSDSAKKYGDQRGAFADMSWKMVQELQATKGSSAKL